MPVKLNKLAQLGEFGLIKHIQSQCKNLSSDVLVGIGDDAAVIVPQKNKTLITSDMMIEGVHFDLSFTTFHQLGYKFIAVNISDIFAMGGTPEHFIVGLGIPPNFKADNIKDLYSGIMKLAKKHKISLIGGDTCTSKNDLILSGTLLGSAKQVVTRSGAKAGDSIYVTAPLGDSAMGFSLLEKRGKKINKFHPSSTASKLMKTHLMPEPAPLQNTSKVTSMIDISDGLLIDVSHICDKSRVGAVIYKESVPLSNELKVMAKKSGMDPLNIALKGGEDYALLFTGPPNMKTSAFKIGEIINKGRYIIDSRGNKTEFKPEGYEHFKKINV